MLHRFVSRILTPEKIISILCHGRGCNATPTPLEFLMQTVICMENKVFFPCPLGFFIPLCQRGMDILWIHTILSYMLKLKNKPMKMKYSFIYLNPRWKSIYSVICYALVFVRTSVTFFILFSRLYSNSKCSFWNTIWENGWHSIHLKYTVSTNRTTRRQGSISL